MRRSKPGFAINSRNPSNYSSKIVQTRNLRVSSLDKKRNLSKTNRTAFALLILFRSISRSSPSMEFLWIRSSQTLYFVPSIDDWPLSSFHERNSLTKKRSVRASLFFFFLKLERFVCTAQQTRRKSGCSCFNTVHGTNDRSIDRYDTAAKGSVFRGIPRGSDKTRREDSARM